MQHQWVTWLYFVTDDISLSQRFKSLQMEAKEWFDKFCQQVELEEKCKEKAWNIWESVSSKIKEKSEVYENLKAHLLFSLFKEANFNLHQDCGINNDFRFCVFLPSSIWMFQALPPLCAWNRHFHTKTNKWKNFDYFYEIRFFNSVNIIRLEFKNQS